jgi:hypothetical protein
MSAWLLDKCIAYAKAHRHPELIDAALEVHWVHSGGDSLGTFPDDRVSEHGRRGRAVTGLVGGLRGNLANAVGELQR